MPTVPNGPFQDAVRAYHLAAAEWLGLDPRRVFQLDVDRGSQPNFAEPGRLPRVTWKSVGRETPTRGWVGPSGMEGDVDHVSYLGSVVVNAVEAGQFLEHIGPEPEFLTARERDILTRAFPDRA